MPFKCLWPVYMQHEVLFNTSSSIFLVAIFSAYKYFKVKQNDLVFIRNTLIAFKPLFLLANILFYYGGVPL